MPFYKDNLNKTHFIDSYDFENLLPLGCVEISKEEYEILIPKISDDDVIKIEIQKLESTITNRRLREAVLTTEGKEWLLDVEAEIQALRDQL